MADTGQQGSLADVLVREGLVRKEQLQEARDHQKITGKTLCRTLIDMNYLSDDDKIKLLQNKYGIEEIPIGSVKVSGDVLRLIPRSEAVRHHLAPVRIEDKHLIVAMEEPQNKLVVDYLGTLSGYQIRPFSARTGHIQNLLDQYPPDDRRFDINGLPFVPKILFKAVLLFVYLLPAFVFFLILSSSHEKAETLKDMITHASVFERALFLMLSWGVWALIMFEITGLLIKDTPPDASA